MNVSENVPPRTIEYYYLYTDLGLTQSEIAEIYGVTRQAVSIALNRNFDRFERGVKQEVREEFVAYYPHKQFDNTHDKLICMMKVGESDKCWDWPFSKSHGGYGHLSLGGVYYYAHRVSYEFFNGEIDDDLSVLHKCDNPSCINPSHLYLGTQEDNVRDRDKNYPDGYYPKRLDKETWTKVRRLYKTGNFTLRQLARKFGFSGTTIYKAIHDDCWRERINAGRLTNG